MEGGNINDEISFCWFKYKPRVKFMDGLKNGKMSVPLLLDTQFVNQKFRLYITGSPNSLYV